MRSGSGERRRGEEERLDIIRKTEGGEGEGGDEKSEGAADDEYAAA